MFVVLDPPDWQFSEIPPLYLIKTSMGVFRA